MGGSIILIFNIPFMYPAYESSQLIGVRLQFYATLDEYVMKHAFYDFSITMYEILLHLLTPSLITKICDHHSTVLTWGRLCERRLSYTAYSSYPPYKFLIRWIIKRWIKWRCGG